MVHRERLTTDAQGEKNIDLTFNWLHSVLDDPSILEEIPNHASIVFLPEDDPELCEANLQMAMNSARQGRDMYLKHVKGASQS